MNPRGDGRPNCPSSEARLSTQPQSPRARMQQPRKGGAHEHSQPNVRFFAGFISSSVFRSWATSIVRSTNFQATPRQLATSSFQSWSLPDCGCGKAILFDESFFRNNRTDTTEQGKETAMKTQKGLSQVAEFGIGHWRLRRFDDLDGLGRSSSRTAKLIFFSTGSMRSTSTRRRSPMR